MYKLKEEVIARINSIPQDVKIVISPNDSYSRDEILEHIENGDKIGEKIISIELDYLKFLEDEKYE